MIIRNMTIDDIKDCVSIYQYIRNSQNIMLNGYFAKQTEETDSNTIKKIVENQNNICLVAILDERIVGILLSERKKAYHLSKPDICEFFKLGVKEEYRHKGIGTSLIKTFIEKSKEQGIQEIILGVFNDNQIAYNLYKKLGFREQEQKMSLKI